MSDLRNILHGGLRSKYLSDVDTDEDDKESSIRLLPKHDQDTVSFSDSEAITRKNTEKKEQNLKSQKYQNYSPGSDWNSNNKYEFLKDNTAARTGYFKYGATDGNNTDDDGGDQTDEDDGFGNSSALNATMGNKLVKTGRQRKKSAARTKGGEFQARRRKKRIYFCCVSSEIDVQKLHDELSESPLLVGWYLRLYSDVLHLHRPGSAEFAASPRRPSATYIPFSGDTDILAATASHGLAREAPASAVPVQMGLGETLVEVLGPEADTNSVEETKEIGVGISVGSAGLQGPIDDYNASGLVQGIDASQFAAMALEEEQRIRISAPGAQEAFIFDFGAVVLWGMSGAGSGPESQIQATLLAAVRRHITRGLVQANEFKSGEDDMAYVTLADLEGGVTIANDVMTIADDAPAKQRLSLSFAIAQSAVLAIFESRIDKKIVEYKYIPEHMATHGRLHLSERQLGAMTGEVFVIRHDVNLHTEILDTPDFFWKDGEKFENDYKLMMRYLEMGARTDVLNKRLDMLRELLDVLQQQMENAHGVKLEMIVIWLVFVEVVLQAIAIAVDAMPKRCVG